MTGSPRQPGRYVAPSEPELGTRRLLNQSAISQAPSIGAIFGVYWGAWLNDRYGYRWSLIVNYLICIPIVFLFFFAQNKEMLLMAGLLIGLPFGCFACLGEAYASEICPIRLRAYMTGYVNICWNIGQSKLRRL